MFIENSLPYHQASNLAVHRARTEYEVIYIVKGTGIGVYHAVTAEELEEHYPNNKIMCYFQPEEGWFNMDGSHFYS